MCLSSYKIRIVANSKQKSEASPGTSKIYPKSNPNGDAVLPLNSFYEPWVQKRKKNQLTSCHHMVVQWMQRTGKSTANTPMAGHTTKKVTAGISGTRENLKMQPNQKEEENSPMPLAIPRPPCVSSVGGCEDEDEINQSHPINNEPKRYPNKNKSQD